MRGDDLNESTIDAALRGSFGRPIRFFASVASTNEVALHWAGRDAPHGALVVADYQSAGRGRWGRTWVAPRGRALLFSVILRPTDPKNVSLVSTALGVAVAEGLEACASLDAKLRWPNDVMVDGRKIAGILVETVSHGGAIDALVAGVGINVATRAQDLPEELRTTATSIAELQGKAPLRAQVLAEMLDGIERVMSALDVEGGREDVVARATARSAVLGREVVARFADGTTMAGTASRLTSTGTLEISVDGRATVLDSAEIVRMEAEDGEQR